MSLSHAKRSVQKHLGVVEPTPQSISAKQWVVDSTGSFGPFVSGPAKHGSRIRMIDVKAGEELSEKLVPLCPMGSQVQPHLAHR